MTTILVVDDMPIFREPIAACLQSHGYNVESAGNGREALDVIRRNVPDLLLLDIGMPVMDGLALLEILVADPKTKNLPVIMLTAIAEKDHVVRAAKLGIRDYMLKSRFSLKELLSRIAARLPTGGAVTTATDPVEVSTRPTATPNNPATAIRNAVPPTTGVAGLQRIVSASDIDSMLRNCEEIRATAPAVQNTLMLTSNEACSVEHVARSIRQDQGLALKILKLANSVTYNRGVPVDSVDTAVQRIGMAHIRQMMMSISVIDRFSSKMRNARLDPLQFWEHSLGCGLIAAELMRAVNGSSEDVDAAFTMSLLHDTGRAVLAEQLGDLYETVLATAEQLQVPVEQVESRMLGTNHAEVMHHILQRWQFGQHLIGPISSHHHSVARLREGSGKNGIASVILALADRLAHALLIGGSGNDTIYPIHELIEWLKLSGDTVAAIALAACDQTNELKYVMLSRSQTAAWPDTRKTVRSKLRTPVRPLFVGDERQADAYRIFFSALGEPTDQPPNLIVTHAARPIARVKFDDLLDAAELEAHVANLPILVISPEGSATLDSSLVRGRVSESVRTPATVGCLIEAVNKLLEPKVVRSATIEGKAKVLPGKAVVLA